MSMRAPPRKSVYRRGPPFGATVASTRPARPQWPRHTTATAPPMTASFAQFRTTLLGAIAAFALAACASLPPPTAELNEAQASVVRATGADADQYAPESIATARDALSRAQAALAEGRDDEARRMALAADAEADLAHARSRQALAEAELAQRRAEVERMRQRLEQAEGGR